MEEAGAESAVDRTLSRLRRIDSRPADESPPVEVTGAAGPVEPRTLADLYRDHRIRLMRLAMLLVDIPATAEDVVQEAFAGLHRHWAGLRDETAAVA